MCSWEDVSGISMPNNWTSDRNCCTRCVSGMDVFQSMSDPMYLPRYFFIAVSLVQAFSPQSYPMQNPGLMSPFAFPFSPNIPPYNLSPTHHPQHNTPSPRHDTSKKKDNASKTSNVSHDKKSTKASSLAESSSSTKAHSPSVKTQSPFIPLQVCTVLSFPN